MSCRDLSQPSFAEALVTGYTQGRGFLEDIDRAFDWGAFGVLLAPIHGSTKGAPGYPPVTMFKIILFQQWCTLSDPARRRKRCATGCRFTGSAAFRWIRRRPIMPRSGGFRQIVDQLGLSEALLAKANRQLDGRGLIEKARHAGGRHHHRRRGQTAYEGGGVNERDPD